MSEVKLPEIPSEILEPHLAKVFGQIIESVGSGYIQPADGIQMLRGIEWFVSMSGGIHSKLVTSNEYDKVTRLGADEFGKLCREVFSSHYK